MCIAQKLISMFVILVVSVHWLIYCFHWYRMNISQHCLYSYACTTNPRPQYCHSDSAEFVFMEYNKFDKIDFAFLKYNACVCDFYSFDTNTVLGEYITQWIVLWYLGIVWKYLNESVCKIRGHSIGCHSILW
jgi:hypothetical protein